MKKSVSFSPTVTTREIPKLSAEQIPRMFYSKFDFRLFQIEKRFSEEHDISQVIHRVAGKIIKDMSNKMRIVESLQEIEKDLMKQSTDENSNCNGAADGALGGASSIITAYIDDGTRDDHKQMEEEHFLQQERCRLVIEREKTKHQLARSMPQSSPIVFDTHDIEMLDPEICNFTPVRFETILCPTLSSASRTTQI